MFVLFPVPIVARTNYNWHAAQQGPKKHEVAAANGGGFHFHGITIARPPLSSSSHTPENRGGRNGVEPLTMAKFTFASRNRVVLPRVSSFCCHTIEYCDEVRWARSMEGGPILQNERGFMIVLCANFIHTHAPPSLVLDVGDIVSCANFSTRENLYLSWLDVGDANYWPMTCYRV